MNLKRFALGDLRSNCYVLYEDNQAFIIDPGYESPQVLSFLTEHNLTLEGVYITHGHFDHWGGLASLRKQYPNILVYAPLKDHIWFEDTTYNYWKYVPKIDIWVKDKDQVHILNQWFSVYETPGHSQGGTVLYHMPILFSGDTLFHQSVGRTDLPFASKDALTQSIKNMYQWFPNETIVYPGHGIETSIGYEKKYNPFIRSI